MYAIDNVMAQVTSIRIIFNELHPYLFAVLAMDDGHFEMMFCREAGSPESLVLEDEEDRVRVVVGRVLHDGGDAMRGIIVQILWFVPAKEAHGV